MALDWSQMSVMFYGNRITHWSYRTMDARREIEAASYWEGSARVYDSSRTQAGGMPIEGDQLWVHHIGDSRGCAQYAFVARDGEVRPVLMASAMQQSEERIGTFTGGLYKEDFAHVAFLLGTTRHDPPESLAAVCSNNLNIIIAALEYCASSEAP